jgi:DNA-binding NarL/FixJ family response regulator
MIVDDTPANLAFLSDALDQVGYKVLVAANGYNAIDQLQYITPDLILLDILMPGLDGFETCRRLKTRPTSRDIPVVFMTALDGTDDIVRGFGLGAVDYVTKPVDPQEVLARIATRLHCSRAIRQFQDAVEVSGDAFVALDDQVRVTLITPLAQDLLGEYFGADVVEGMSLPDSIQDLLAVHGPAGEPFPRILHPAVDRNGKHLMIRAATCARSTRAMLVLEEHQAHAPSPAALTAALGLTQREAEVLLWVIKGKTNRDIGIILGVSPRTVNKHLEHVYIKLGVETRTAAANKVMAVMR